MFTRESGVMFETTHDKLQTIHSNELLRTLKEGEEALLQIKLASKVYQNKITHTYTHVVTNKTEQRHSPCPNNWDQLNGSLHDFQSRGTRETRELGY